MEIDGETVRQITLATVVCLGFVAALVFVGESYGLSGGGGLSPGGGLAMVGVLAGFIFVMALIGLWLERQEFDSD